MLGWPVIGLTSDRVGAATWRDPFYTIQINAVWPSSDSMSRKIWRASSKMANRFIYIHHRKVVALRVYRHSAPKQRYPAQSR